MRKTAGYSLTVIWDETRSKARLADVYLELEQRFIEQQGEMQQ